MGALLGSILHCARGQGAATAPGHRDFDPVDPLHLAIASSKSVIAQQAHRIPGQPVAAQHMRIPLGGMLPFGMPGMPLQLVGRGQQQLPLSFPVAGGQMMLPSLAQIQMMMNNMQAVSGGIIGEAEHFLVEDTEAGMLITADLPHHQLGDAGNDPLTVQIIGRTLVVKGTHVVKQPGGGAMHMSFQRSFHIPSRAAVSMTEVTYSGKSGKLVISIPARLVGEKEDADEKENAQKRFAGSDAKGKEDPFSELEENLRRFFGDSALASAPARKDGFLSGNIEAGAAPKPEHVVDLFEKVVEQPLQSQTLAGRTLSDNSRYLGCFAEDELPARNSRTKVPESGTYSEMKARAEGWRPSEGDRKHVEVDVINASPEPVEVRPRGAPPEENSSSLKGSPGAGKPTLRRMTFKSGDTVEWRRAGGGRVEKTELVFPGLLRAIWDGPPNSTVGDGHEEIAETLDHDRQQFFAIARSMGKQLATDPPLTVSGRGAGFVFSGIPHMPPKFGSVECGMRCIDGEHWCGCDPTADQDIFVCPQGQRRYAVYQLPGEDGAAASPPRSRAIWHLGKGSDGKPVLEVHAPPGRLLKEEKGRLYVVRNSSTAEAGHGLLTEAEDMEDDHLAHVGVPLDLADQDCKMADDESSISCRLQENHVKQVPVQYLSDEL